MMLFDNALFFLKEIRSLSPLITLSLSLFSGLYDQINVSVDVKNEGAFCSSDRRTFCFESSGGSQKME